MKSLTIDWLSKKSPEFGQLSENEKIAIIDFSLLWNFFEARCLDNNANIDRIRQYVHQLPEELVDSPEIQKLADYFRERYIDGAGYSNRYPHLHLERSGNPSEVARMLRGQSENRETLIGCLGIVFRYRNNLFHGKKWDYELQEQQENFERSTALLRWLIGTNT